MKNSKGMEPDGRYLLKTDADVCYLRYLVVLWVPIKHRHQILCCINMVKGKGKGHPRTGHELPEAW